MPTSISLPPDLLDRVDRAAHRKSMSRSQFITTVLSRAVVQDEEWPRFFFENLIDSAMTAAGRKDGER